MTLTEEILTVLASRPEGLTDANLAQMLGKRHQHVNQVCRQLATDGIVQRGQRHGTIVNLLAGSGQSDQHRPAIPAQASLSERSWDWEGNVQAVLCRWLSTDGWSLAQVADTASRERGTDIVAERAGERLHIEVKGYPSKTYADPRRVQEVKPTHPTLQAKHWYAAVLHSAVRLREQHPHDRVAIGLPEAARYRALIQEIHGALRLLRIDTFVVAEDGTVTEMTRGAGDDAA